MMETGYGYGKTEQSHPKINGLIFWEDGIGLMIMDTEFPGGRLSADRHIISIPRAGWLQDGKMKMIYGIIFLILDAFQWGGRVLEDTGIILRVKGKW